MILISSNKEQTADTGEGIYAAEKEPIFRGSMLYGSNHGNGEQITGFGDGAGRRGALGRITVGTKLFSALAVITVSVSYPGHDISRCDHGETM